MEKNKNYLESKVQTLVIDVKRGKRESGPLEFYKRGSEMPVREN